MSEENYYIETRYNDKGLGLVELFTPDEAEDLDTTPFSSCDGYDRYMEKFDNSEDAHNAYDKYVYTKTATELYDIMSAEQDKYRDWLLTQPPEEILNHTFEYTVREDILIAIENTDIDEFDMEQLTALISSVSPLDDVCRDFENLETDYMDTIRGCIRERGNELIERNKERARDKPSVIEKLQRKTAEHTHVPKKDTGLEI